MYIEQPLKRFSVDVQDRNNGDSKRLQIDAPSRHHAIRQAHDKAAGFFANHQITQVEQEAH